MKKKFYLPGLNSKSRKDIGNDANIESIISTIDSGLYPLIYKFTREINKFYQEEFNELDLVKLREKRLLDFETPNRAKIVHELDIELPSNFNYTKFYYLFNPFNRLSWLKITQENKRLIVADNKKAKSFVYDVISNELSSLASSNNISANDLFDYLWEHKLGYPCFIKIEDVKCETFILKAEYFDSIKSDNSNNNLSASLFFPIEERTINYEYYPLKERSSWLYLKAPKNFNISIDNIDYQKEINSVDEYSSRENNSDPDINSLTIVNSGVMQDVDINVRFDINITVPESLKIWYLAIYYSSLTILMMLSFHLINSMYFSLDFPVLIGFNPLEKILINGNFNGVILTVVAGIIATRGWLISEETILKKYSRNLTIVMILLLLIPALNYLFGFQ
ncbi:MAG: hypothetical protein PHE08_08105 [Bacteroidales bacterium]|nr:hypothetical protein [Bacteroidales bacterium]